MYVKNREKIVSHGYEKGRKIALDIIEHALRAADPYIATKNLVKLHGETLTVGSLHFDLSQRGNIYVLGAGKATFPIAKALEEILGERITEGLVIVKRGQNGILKKIKIREASHPLPDIAGFEAAKEIMEIAKKAQRKDIVFCAITGGSSALAPLPIPGISLEEKRQINKLLLTSGATIREINTVRKHLSNIKGGKLALSIFPAEIINLTVSDATGDPLDYITGPTVPDTSTFPEALSVLKKYNLWDKFPKSAIKYLQNATPELETPKNFGEFSSLVHSFILIKSRIVCEAAAEKAKELGFNTLFLSSFIEGETREVAKVHTAIAKEIISTGNPIPSPACVISGGETTVTVKGDGLGGRNLEFALASGMEIDGLDGVVILSAGTDGTDGPTDAAGGIVDGTTVKRARELGLDPLRYLERNDSYHFFSQLDDLIITGPTNTNVMDIRLVLMSL